MFAAFARINGILLSAVFGSLSLILWFQYERTISIEENLQEEPDYIFVTLDRAQQKQIGPETHHYYSYSGTYRGRKITYIERVSPGYFYLHSEGKTVQAFIFEDDGILYTQLRGNQLQGEKDLSLLYISLSCTTVGMFLLILGIIFRISRSPVNPKQTRKDTNLTTSRKGRQK